MSGSMAIVVHTMHAQPCGQVGEQPHQPALAVAWRAVLKQ